MKKDLLIKDLCARLPYGIICKCTYPVNNETTDGEDVLFTNDYEIEGIRRRGAGFANYRRWYEITFDGETYDIDDDGIKVIPYLRPMSSMTEEEKKEFDKVLKSCNNKVFACPDNKRRYNFFDAEQEDFMNAHHFDHRGLISMGIALEAPEGMYNVF